ncbi:MAG: hypothetical protein ACOC3G_04160 [Phycisphaeraceae bacterium]
MTHRTAASHRLRFARRLRVLLCLHRPAVAVALLLLLGMGCTAVREPLSVIEPSYRYHDQAVAADETLSRLYAVPIEEEGTVAAAGRLDITID